MTCTYFNEQQKGKLTVKKVTIGGDDTFNFTVQGQSGFTLHNGGQQSFDLAPGSYSVSETNLPNGWTLQGASCSQGGTLTGTTISATVTSNVTTTCTFTNFKKKDDRAGDVTKLFIHRRVDNLLSNEPDRARVIRRLDDDAPAAGLKDGGSYDGYSGGGTSSLPGSLKDRPDALRLSERPESMGTSGLGDQKFSDELE